MISMSISIIIVVGLRHVKFVICTRFVLNYNSVISGLLSNIYNKSYILYFDLCHIIRVTISAFRS